MGRGYPLHREADVVLRDGSTVRVRPIRPDDEGALLAFLHGLSEEARWLRFFSAGSDLERTARRSVEVDYHDRLGLVALSGGRIVGHAVYLRVADGRGECAFAVADELRGKGLGTILLGHLAEAASENGVEIFEADVRPENHRMIQVFRDSGFPLRTHAEPGTVRVEFPTSLTADARERFEQRERTAAVAAVRSFLEPRSVAVIGASRSRGTIGGEVFHNLVTSGFPGAVYPVNPTADVVQSVAAYPSVTAVSAPVDLAVVVVPAAAVADVARGCAQKGVRALVVISAGFAETGEEGAARQRELVEICRSSGMRLIGPNCMGVVNASPAVRLNATFGPTFPPHGRMGFLSQSGALGLAVIDRAAALGMGLSSFISVGNKADISGNDCIQYWEEDENTDLILLYLESFGNPRRFARIARRVGRTKPVVVVKSGRSRAGARATTSHTGALLAASDVTVEALFRQAGVIRTDTLAELFDVASLLATQPLPAGNRVGIVTNAGGPGILCADACEANGLEVVLLPEPVKAELRSFLPAAASVENPVDMIASASAEDYRRVAHVLAASGAVDAVVTIFIPPLATRAEDVAEAIGRSARESQERVPFLTVFMQSQGVLQPDGGGARMPVYAFPEEAARALAFATAHAEWRRKPPGKIAELPDVRRDEAAGILASALTRGSGWLEPGEIADLFACYGIPMAEWRMAAGPEDAGAAAKELGGEVALKAVGPGLVHKTEAGAVRLALAGEPAVTAAAGEMAAAIGQTGSAPAGFVVQRMVPGGVEMLVGVVHDPVFGPVVACGAGGTAVDLLGDVAVRIAPISEADAGEMVRELATFPLLDGYRGAPKADVRALEDVLLRVSALVEEQPAIAELDCNPVMVLPDRALVVDARVRVEPPTPPVPLSGRRAP